jgi:ATP-dependent Clp protease ATP-binding subunit ClpB
MLQEEKDRLLQMESKLHRRIIGQDEAVRAVSEAIRRQRAGLGDHRRPMGSFLFVGPTGVGKTELAKALAEFLFASEEALTRIDMSEYMEKHSVARMIGAPPGYVGYEEGGQLTEAVRRKPYTVILLDEIEKAHPDVFNLLLQMLDDGRLTDSKGRTINFRNAVVIMTSNVGSAQIRTITQREGQHADVRRVVLEELDRTFRPEFLNRIDEIVIFRALDRQQMRDILELLLGRVTSKMAELELKVEFSEDVKEKIVAEGFDPTYGARPLKRVIQRLLENPLSNVLLSGKVDPGGSVSVDLRDGEVVFTCAPAGQGR